MLKNYKVIFGYVNVIKSVCKRAIKENFEK